MAIGDARAVGRSAATIAEISRLALGATDPGVAGEILDRLHELVDYDAAALSAFDPIAGGHATLANRGYPAHVLSYLEGPFTEHDIGYARCLARGVPLRMCDVPYDYHASSGYLEVFGPAGYSEGMTACLRAADGRYTGMVNVSTSADDEPSDEARDALLALMPVLARFADASRGVSEVARTLDADAYAAVVCGAVARAVPGFARSEALEDGSPLLDAAAAFASSTRTIERFLWRDGGGGWHRVQIAAARQPRPFGRRVAVVVERPIELPFGLTAREVAVLTQLARGATNVQIAAELVTARSTISTHVEHILAKLGCETRSAAAAIAVGEGLLARGLPAGDARRRARR